MYYKHNYSTAERRYTEMVHQREGSSHSEGPDVVGEGGREEEDLSVTGHEGHQLVQSSLIVHREQLVSFVQDQHVALTGVGYSLLQQIQQSPWGGHYHMDWRRERGREGERELNSCLFF